MKSYREQAELDNGSRILFTERQLILGSYPIHIIFLLLGLTSNVAFWGHTIISMLSIYNWTNEGEDKKNLQNTSSAKENKQ